MVRYIVGFCVVITFYVGGREVGCPTVYEVSMVRYIVGFCVVITFYVGGREVGCPTVYEVYMVRYIVGVRAHPLALLRRRVPPITVGPHPGSQYLAPALALGSPVLAPQGHPTSGYLVKSPLTISFASVRVRSCELRRYNHPRHTLTTN